MRVENAHHLWQNQGHEDLKPLTVISEMLEAANKSAVIEPDRPNLQEALAELHRQLGEAEQAAEYRERAEKLKALRAKFWDKID